jgi:hypothetical protein
MKRRDMFKAATWGVGAVTIGALPQPLRAMSESADVDVDVLVVGGGTAGTIAALQAARADARTMLVEKGSQLGGTTTTGGVDFPGLFHAWEQQVIAGIGWELVTRAVALNSGTLPDFDKPPQRHWEHQVRVNGPLYASLAEEACLAAGVLLAYYEIPLSVAPRRPAGWWRRSARACGVASLVGS